MVLTVRLFNLVNIISSAILLLVKITIAVMSNSIAVFSDALQTIIDVFVAVSIFYLMRLSIKKPDSNHPYGHSRAEPLGALIIAIIATVVGIEIIHSSIMRLISPERLDVTGFLIGVYIATIVVKMLMYLFSRHFNTTIKSQAIKAITIDHRNDLMVAFAILLSMIAVKLGDFSVLDSALGIIVGLFIIYSGWTIGKDNIRFLMGESPSDLLLSRIIEAAKSVKNVKGVHDVKAHYIGLVLNVEVHIELDKSLTLLKSHAIGKDVEKAVDEIEGVNKAFIHIDPR